MNADFLAMLGGAAGPSSASSRRDEGKSLLSFKAGKMTAELKENGKYLVSPDPRRGIIDMKWTANGSSGSGSGSNGGLLKLEWIDRRTNATVDSLTIFPEDDCTYSKVDTGREGDRVYLLQYGNNSERRFFFWMQEKEEGNQDEENCVKINMYMADAEEAAAAANGTTTDGNDSAGASSSTARTEQAALDELAALAMNGLNTNSTDSSSNDNAQGSSTSSSGNEGLVDISSILSNANTTNTTSANTSSNEESKTEDNAPSTGGLTLSDLQGAMAGLATTSPPAAASPPGPPLDELATPSAVIESGILNDEAVKARLIELLPEGQRTEEKLMENIRSPQVAQCLKSLTAALCDDEGGSMDSFNSILANFQLDPSDGALSMAVGNPIQAFLDCVLKSVQKEKEAKNDQGNAEEGKDQDTEMSED